MKKDITFLIPSMNGGGAEKVTMLLANELCSRGWAVTLLMTKAEGPYFDRLHHDIKIHVLKNRNISKNILEISDYLRQAKPSIFYSSMMYVNVIAGLACKIARYKGRAFFSEHSHITTMIANNKSLSIKTIVFLAKWLYKSAYSVICVSAGVKEDMMSVIKNVKNPVVINNPIESLLQPDVPISPKYRLISMGRLDRDKNFKCLIEAFAEVLHELGDSENYELYILGEGYERTNLENLISNLKLSKQIFLPGFVSSPAQLLNSSHLFVFPSVREGFGNVLVEALSCGLPVISTDCKSGPSEILLDGKIGALVPINNKTALKEAILNEIKNPDKVSTKEQRIKRANDFLIEDITDKYESLFVNN